MKHSRLILASLLSLCSVIANAHDFEANGIYYNITDEENKTVEVSYKGTNGGEYSDEYAGKITIPKSVRYNKISYKVTSIGNEAFNGCTKLTSIEIPNSVTSIGNYAFQHCNYLATIKLPNDVTYIGNDAFYGTSWLANEPDGLVYIGKVLYSYKGEMPSNTTVKIKEGTTQICYKAFYNYSNLTSVEIPNSVTSIGDYAFRSCYGLTNIEIPNSVTSIGEYAFTNCDAIEYVELNCDSIGSWFCYKQNIKEVVLGENVTKIGNFALYDCTGITSITIPDGVTSIGEHAFNSCSAITSITIGSGVTDIGNEAFSNCNAIEHVELNCDSIGSWFGQMQSIKEVVLGENVTKIGNNAFYYCSGITNITIPSGVTCIGDYAFNNCSGITSIEIPDSVTSIGDYAFYSCSNLKRIITPDGITHIGNNAFDGTVWFENRPDGVIYIGKVLYRYYGTMPYNTSIKIKDGTTQICYNAFSNCSGLTSVEIPNSVTSIGDYAFSNCYNLTSIEIPNSVTSIGNNAFTNCDSLTSIEIPNSVTSIGYEAFSSCSGLTNIEIPNSVTSIGDNAFGYCYHLTSIVIGNSVTSIGDYAFGGCEALKTVINFSNLIIEKGSTTNGHAGHYAEKVVNAPNGEMVGNYAFYTADSVNYLGGYIGDETDLVLPSDYNGENYAINNVAFKRCTSINSVVFPEGVTAIGNDAFSGCKNIKRIELPNSITSIGDYSFAYCTKLDYVAIPANVTYIGEAAFEGCMSLDTIRSLIPAEELFAPGDYAFHEIDKENCILYVPEGAKDAYAATPGWNEFYNIVETNSLFTVTFIVDGEVYDVITVEYGDEIPLPATPEKEGYTFSGWNEIPETMPAKDITITGSFSKIGTGIDELEEDDSGNSLIYDLNGRKLEEITDKGIYIINGKRVLVK